MTMLGTALEYASLGLHVFPLHPRAKTPATPNGCKDASVDPADLRAMWRDPACNIGIAAGGASGVFVLDVDGEDGRDSLRTLQAVYGSLPVTPEVETARGRHIYLRYPGAEVDFGNSASKVARGIDVRTDGGYVVAPPSIHPSGDVYLWVDGLSPFEIAFADAPDWLIAKLVKKPQPFTAPPAPERDSAGHTRYGAKAIEVECAELATLGEGQRNQKLNAVAFRVGQLVHSGHLQESAARSEVLRAASACGLGETESVKTFASGFAAGIKTPNASDPRPEQYLAAQESRRFRAQHRPDPEPPPIEQPPANEPADDSMTAAAVAKAALDYLVDESRLKMPRTGFARLDEAIGGLPPGTMMTVGGRTGAGKSSLLLSMAMKQSRNEQRVGIVSCEDADWIWGARILGALRGINTDEFFKTAPDPGLVGHALLAVQEAADYGIHFSFQIGKPVKSILAAVHTLIVKHGCNVIMVDYLQAIAARGQDRYMARTDAAQAIKGLCYDTRKTPLVLASQLKRPENGNPFREPTNNDLKDSGDIENMSESILLLWPRNDDENAPAFGKVSKVKWSPKRPRFQLVRHPVSGALESLIEPVAREMEEPAGRRRRDDWD